MPSTSNSSSVLQVKKSLKLLLVINLCRHYKRRDLFTRQFKPGVYSPLLWSCQRLMCGSKGDGSESFLKVILQCKFNKLEYSRGVVKIPRFPSPPPPFRQVCAWTLLFKICFNPNKIYLSVFNNEYKHYLSFLFLYTYDMIIK